MDLNTFYHQPSQFIIFFELQITGLCDSLLEIIMDFCLNFRKVTEDFLHRPYYLTQTLKDIFLPIHQIPLTSEDAGNFPHNIQGLYLVLVFKSPGSWKEHYRLRMRYILYLGKLTNGLLFSYKIYEWKSEYQRYTEELSLARTLTEARRWLLDTFDDNAFLWTQAINWRYGSRYIFWTYDSRSASLHREIWSTSLNGALNI